MKNKLILLIMITCTFSACKNQNIDGTYSGLIEICSVYSTGKKDCYVDSNRLQAKWYHKVDLKIKGDSIYSDMNPVTIDNKDTLASASDGAFYYYKGTIKHIGKTLSINLREITCDYCSQQVKRLPNGKIEIVKDTKIWEGEITANGLKINNVLFKPTKTQHPLISETRTN